MRSVTRQIMTTFSDLTLGTVIVLVHVALADREHEKRTLERRSAMLHVAARLDHTHDRSPQISR